VTRLVDMGVEPFLVASSLLGVLAQRLVRKLCPVCRREHIPDVAERKMLDDSQGAAGARSIYIPGSCAACANTGYQGRTGIYELLSIDDSMRTLIHDGASEGRLRDYARARGMRTIRDDGLRWVRAGATSLEEVLRVTRE
jgi:general secretion pathway protein E